MAELIWTHNAASDAWETRIGDFLIRCWDKHVWAVYISFGPIMSKIGSGEYSNIQHRANAVNFLKNWIDKHCRLLYGSSAREVATNEKDLA